MEDLITLGCRDFHGFIPKSLHTHRIVALLSSKNLGLNVKEKCRGSARLLDNFRENFRAP